MARFTAMMCIMLLASMTVGEGTPTTPTPSSAADTGNATKTNPDEHDKMAQDHGANQTAMKDAADVHKETQKAAQADMELENLRGQQLGAVTIAHLKASDEHDRAGKLAQRAVETRMKANQAAKERADAREALTEAEKNEADARMKGLDADTAEVESQVKTDSKVEQTSEALATMQRDEEAMNTAKDEHAAASTHTYNVNHSLTEATNALNEAVAHATQMSTDLASTTAKFEKATQELNTLLHEEATKSETLGQMEAAAATEGSKYTKCQQDRAATKDEYDKDLEKFNSLDAEAVRMEAEAQDKATTATDLANTAAKLAATVAA